MSGGISFNPGHAAPAAVEPSRKRKSSQADLDDLEGSLESSWIQDIHSLELHGLEQEHEEVFLEIYKTLYELNFASLVFHKLRLEGLAEQVRSVPPLSFLILIQKQPQLKTYLSGIKEAAMNFPWLLRGQSPWERTVADFQQSFLEHKQRDILGLPALLERIEKEPARLIQRWIEQNQFRELLEYFVMN